MTTATGGILLESHRGGCDYADEDQMAEWIAAIEVEAVEKAYGSPSDARLQRDIDMVNAAVTAERERIIKGIRVSRDSMPIWSHVDSYGLGQVLKGNPWPEGR